MSRRCGEVAGAEALRALLQAADRHDHAARQQPAGGEREQQAEAEQGQRLDERLIDRASASESGCCTKTIQCGFGATA